MKWWSGGSLSSRWTESRTRLSFYLLARIEFHSLKKRNPISLFALKSERGSLILSFEIQARPGARSPVNSKRWAAGRWAHLATTSHGERTCRPNFPFHHLTDFDVNPFFTSKSGKCFKWKIGLPKLIWDVTFFFWGRVVGQIFVIGNHQRWFPQLYLEGWVGSSSPCGGRVVGVAQSSGQIEARLFKIT